MIILFGLSIMTFGLTYILPSNPAEQLAESMGAGHDKEVIEKIEEKYGLNKSFGEQYIRTRPQIILSVLCPSLEFHYPASG